MRNNHDFLLPLDVFVTPNETFLNLIVCEYQILCAFVGNAVVVVAPQIEYVVSMLKPFIRTAGLVTIALMVGMAFCILLGRSRPVPETLKFIDYLICNINECESIVIDESLSGSAVDYQRVVGELQTQDEGLIHFDLFDVRYWHSIRDDVLVVSIEPTTEADLIFLGNVLVYYGLPCSVTITEESVNLQYHEFFAIVSTMYNLSKAETLSTASLSAFMPVDVIELLNGAISCDTPLTFATSQNIISDWHGFQTIGFYVSNNTNP